MAPPVFILTVPRSCSTVASALLAGHPGVYGFPELALFSADGLESILDGSAFPGLTAEVIASRVSGLTRAVAEIAEGRQDPGAIGRAETWLRGRAHWPTWRVMAWLFERAAPAVPLEKSTEAGVSAACLARYRRFDPAARFVHLTRHPRSTLASMLVMLPAITPGPASLPELARYAARIWADGHEALLDTLPRERTLRIRAEDLLGDPETVLRRIAAWLGLGVTDAAVAEMLRTERWQYGSTGPEGGLGGGDPGFLGSPRLRALEVTPSTEFDPAWNLTGRAHSRLMAVANRLGY